MDFLAKQALNTGSVQFGHQAMNAQKSALKNADSELAALEQVASQFEAHVLKIMLKNMRSSEALIASDSPLSQSGDSFYQTMHDEQLANSLSQNQQFGLAKLLVSQFSNSVQGAKKSQNIGFNRDKAAQFLANQPIQKPVKAEAISPEIKTPDDFVEAVLPSAKKLSEKTGLPADILVAQAALETGWGKTIKTAQNNLFGIKADARWSGDTITKNTSEYNANGSPINTTARFRAYESIDASLRDYANFVSESPRYQQAFDQRANSEAYIRSLEQAGYATDPNYADKVLDITRRPWLQNKLATQFADQ